MKNYTKKLNLHHSLIFFLLINVFSIIIDQNKNFVISPFICLFLILCIGISHGSLDHIKGKKLLNILKINNIFFFYISYICISLLVILLWVIFPATSLILFLIIASYHFGKEDSQFLINKISYFDQILFFFKGSLIVLAPMFFHFEETVSLFKLLLVENEFFYSTLEFIEKNMILFIGLILSTLSSIFLLVKKFEIKKFTIFFDYFSILILNYYFEPLIAFTIYFCFLHSIRHSISLIYEIDSSNFNKGLKIFIKKALPLTILTAVL